MKQVVYADLLFLVNFSMDFLCFYVTARLLHKDVRVFRMILASALGGVYSVLILFIKLQTVFMVVVDLLACAIMCFLAFGTKKGGLYSGFISFAVYFGVSAGTGGCMTAMYSLLNRMDLPIYEAEQKGDSVSVWVFALLAIVSGVMASLGGDFFKSVSSESISKVKIEYNGSSVFVNGMVDTGNLISEPISGKAIIVLDEESAARLIGKECVEKAVKGDFLGVMLQNSDHKIRAVPINTAGGNSMLCAFVPDKVTIDVSGRKGKKQRTISVDALFAPSSLSFDYKNKALGCGALVPVSLIS